MVIDKLLKAALEKHKSGDINAAEALYHQILTYQPNDADVLNLLGVLSLQRCDLDQAHILLKRAIESEDCRNPQQSGTGLDAPGADPGCHRLF